MTFPEFYQADNVGTLYTPSANAAITSGTHADVAPADEDQKRVALLLIDTQVDFIHEDGALSVPGAIDDTRRTIEWLFNNTGRITRIYASLDSHLPIQIFSPAWWQNADGQHPDPYTIITQEQVSAGAWQPLYQADWSREYVERLEENAKKQLMIWPYHTLIGTPGHNITPALYEAITYHAAARKTQPRYIEKGTIPYTEHYSLFEPEVKSEALKGESVNTDLLEELAEYDTIYVAGQAKSHCVLESVGSMMHYFDDRLEVIQKIHILEDAMSSVQSPDVDFEQIATDTFARFAEHGLNLTNTREA